MSTAEALAFVEQLTKVAKASGMSCLEVHVGDVKVELHFKAPEVATSAPALVKP